jgi:hypothetical protein
MNTARAIFGGLALIAAAVLVGEPGRLGAQAAPEPGQFRLMTPSLQGANESVFRIDVQTGQVSVCSWNFS